jgi:hypothetical protein
MSKGSRPRPFSVSPTEFQNNMDRIFGEKPKKERYVPPPLPDAKEENNTLDWGNVKDSNQGG